MEKVDGKLGNGDVTFPLQIVNGISYDHPNEPTEESVDSPMLIKGLVPFATPDESGHQFDINLYSNKKSAAQGLLDLALLMANASQLRHLILSHTADPTFRIIMIVLVSTSIILQIVIGIGLLHSTQNTITNDMVGNPSTNRSLRSRRKLAKADNLNNTIVIAIFILTVINVFISAFGLSEAPNKA